MASETNELDVARAIAAGELASPQKYANLWLFALRISGTGVSYRPKRDEFVLRKPEDYLTSEFLARCNGLPVLWRHPPTDILTSEEFSKRIIGTLFFPYVKDDEVWGIAKIYNEEAAQRMQSERLSTSPSVVAGILLRGTIEIDDGEHTLVVEDKPKLTDHIAIVSAGVWDKGEAPTGVRADSTKGQAEMTEEEIAAKKKADAEAEEKAKADAASKLDAIADSLQSLHKRMDAMEETEKRRGEAEKDPDKRPGDPEQLAADAAKAKADAAEAKKRIDEVAAMVKPVSDDDHAKLAEEWTRADEAFTSLGRPTPRPMPGETAPVFRRRVAQRLKEFSPRWKDIDLSTKAFPDDVSFAVVADQIRADAVEFAKSPASVPNGGLVMRTKTVNGHVHNTFLGDPNAWMSRFTGPTKQKAKGAWRYQFSDGQCVSA
jgi:hypothetical protein